MRRTVPKRRKERRTIDNIIPFPERPKMNLEEVESRCLNYLRQSQKPIVAVSTLLEHCQRAPGCEDLEAGVFHKFLKQHGDIHYIEGPADASDVPAETLAAAGLDMGPRVILSTRTPSVNDISSMMAEQLAVMTDSLERALADSAEKGDTEKELQLRTALGRAGELREKMRRMQSGAQEDPNT